jgi:mono/diheme cytochrome c family protein
MKKTGMLVLFAALSLFATASFGADDKEKGERMFKAKCGSCHGKDGTGKTKKGEQMGIGDMTTAAWQTEFTDDKIKETLAKGIKRDKNGKKQEMDALGAEMKPEDIDALIKVVRSLKK